MGREIRISIDDDEVFERMKARKRELDLSWEDVLHRGLRRPEPERPPQGQPTTEPQYRRTAPRDPISDPSGFADDLKRQIQGHVRESLQASLAVDTDPLEADVETLESAEDAVLVFDFLDEEAHVRSNQVPLRVTLAASAEGLDIEVVAVREGKSVTDMNAFAHGVRRRIIERLAAGEGATLSLAGGGESYQVSPALAWNRSNGVPTVSEVEIEEVQFDEHA